MEEDNFLEFENAKIPYRRNLLPWWIWVLLWLFVIACTIELALSFADVYNGSAFDYSILGIYKVCPAPYYSIISIVTFSFFCFTTISLWFQKKDAVVLGVICAYTGLTVCFAVMGVGIFISRFHMRFEILPLFDFLFRMKDIKKRVA